MKETSKNEKKKKWNQPALVVLAEDKTESGPGTRTLVENDYYHPPS